MPENSQPTFDNHLTGALKRMFRPLILFLLSRGFTYTKLIQLVRPVFVELCEEMYKKNGSLPSDSQISLSTGIARRYVKELRFRTSLEQDTIPKITPAAKLIALWISQERYKSKDNQPKSLPRLANNSKSASFEELARRASNDVHPRTLLDNLLERNLVAMTSDDMVQLNSSAYMPSNKDEDMLEIFSLHMRDHLASTTSNIAATEKPFFDRSAFQDGLTAESVEKLNAYIEKHGMELLKEVYALAESLAEQDKCQKENTHRYRLGIYTYHETESNP